MKSYAEHTQERESAPLKLRTARTLKWNTIDRVASQVLYAVVGVVLANVLSKEDFGLVGALLVFQAFAMIFVDSGFGAALLQKKEPTQTDYSTVFWFNLIVSVSIYVILFLSAPLIADLFQGDKRLIPLSKVMFLTFVVNGLAIVQTNRLMKQMDVKQIAIANTVALILSGITGVWLALIGAGAWALVWQTLTLAVIKTGWLWITGGWIPSMRFSKKSFAQIWRVGVSVFSSSLLNTICLNIYNFVIGAFYNLRELGVYTQADKWSKMGSSSLSQIMTATFVPLLSKFQDSRADFHRYMKRINRMAAFITLPVLCGLAAVGAPLFHLLFGNKWDEAIVLFQLLCVRGVFVVFFSVCNNYLLALGRAKAMMIIETIKDVLIIIAIFSTIFFHSLAILVVGQLLASVITYLFVLAITVRATGYNAKEMLKDIMPFALLTAIMSGVCLIGMRMSTVPLLQLLIQLSAGAAVYLLSSYLLKFPELVEGVSYLFGRFIRKRKLNEN